MSWAAAVSKEKIILSCEHLGFRYSKNEHPVFSDLSFQVKRGEAVLLMGKSGGGKSTLAYCLAGLYPEYAGEMEGTILVHGQELSKLGAAERAKKVSILFQNPDNQFCMDKVEHEVLFTLENMNYQGDLRKRAHELLRIVGLEYTAGQPIYTLSGGMKQKLALCTALATEADMLILDEPFANLDPKACESLAELLRKMKERGLTLLVVDHKPQWWLPFMDRIVLMEENGNLDEGSIYPEEIQKKRELFEKRGLFLDDRWLSAYHAAELGADSETMVLAEQLTLYHGKKPFLKDLSFRIEKGSVTALVGTCGSGKTTLLQAMAGIGRKKGRLELAGRPGLVFQNPRFQFLSLSVQEEVLTTLRAVYGKKAEEAVLKRKAGELLEEFGLRQWEKESPYTLSQGQQRRLALLAMLAGDCPLMLLDEPTYAQDERSTRFIMDLLMSRVKDGLTVVMATHDLALAKACANQILLLQEGKLTAIPTEEWEGGAL